MNKLIFLIVLLASVNSYGEGYKGKRGDFVLFAGTVGPLLVVQQGVEAMASLRVQENICLDLFIGSVSTNSTSPSNDRDYGGLAVSIFPLKGTLGKLVKNLNTLFGRVSYTYHDYAKVTGLRDKERKLWTAKSHGLELGFGGRLRRNKAVFEIVPILYYQPLWKRTKGPVSQKQDHFRVLNFKVGYEF